MMNLDLPVRICLLRDSSSQAKVQTIPHAKVNSTDFMILYVNVSGE